MTIMVKAYSSKGLIMYGFFMFAPLGRGEDFQYVDCHACFGCC